MKALSIQQPWLHAILHEGKDIENRSWTRNFTGWIALHSPKKSRPKAKFPSRCGPIPDLKSLDYSAICGVARVVKIVTKSRSKWFEEPKKGEINYGWVLADVVSLKRPIRCDGARQLWEVDAKIVREIQRQLPRLKLDA